MKRLTCPICEKETVWKGNPDRPFCSERCKLIDLASWIGGEYVIPGSRVNPPPSDQGQDVDTEDNRDRP